MSSLLRSDSCGRGRQGQAIGIDFAIGLTIFLVTVALGFIYANMVAVPSSPFSESVQRSALDGSDRFIEINEWSVQKIPITVETSYNEEMYPVELLYWYPDDLDENSTVLMNAAKELRSQTDISLNETVMYANLTDGISSYNIIYSRGTDLPQREYESSIYREADDIWNEDVNITTDSDGLSSLSFQGNILLNDLSLTSGSSTREYTDGPLRITVTYDGDSNHYMRLFDQDNRIRVRQDDDTSTTYTFDLIDTYDEVYLENYTGESQTNSTDQDGTIYSGEADVADFHDNDATTHSLGVFHEDMDITITNNSGDLEADLTLDENETRALIYPHTGDETEIATQIDLFFDRPMKQIAPRIEETGVSTRKVGSFKGGTDSVIRDTLGFSGLGFNVTLDRQASMGESLPGSQEVAVIETPVSLLGRFGNTTLTDLRVSLWL